MVCGARSDGRQPPSSWSSWSSPVSTRIVALYGSLSIALFAFSFERWSLSVNIVAARSPLT